MVHLYKQHNKLFVGRPVMAVVLLLMMMMGVMDEVRSCGKMSFQREEVSGG